MLVAYEIQTFQAGEWKIDSIFDSKDLAVYEAQRLGRSSRYLAVRVVEERFDERKQSSTQRIAFKYSRIEAENEAARVRAADAVREAEQEKVKSQVDKVQRTAEVRAREVKGEARRWWSFLLLKLGLIAVAGIGLLILLRYIARIN